MKHSGNIKNLTPRYETFIATNTIHLDEWLSLRFQVFAQEQGAIVNGADLGIDTDHYDDFCDHLLVRETKTGKIVGGTRILSDSKAQLAGGFYSEVEFDLSKLLPLSGKIIEIGRTCIHADYRRGSVIATLWSGLAEYMLRHNVDYMLGCASISLDDDDGLNARQIMQYINNHYPAPDYLVAKAKQPLPSDTVSNDCDTMIIPPLLKAYLRLGVFVAPVACIDPEFNVADAFILLETPRLHPRYRKHFIETQAQANQ